MSSQTVPVTATSSPLPSSTTRSGRHAGDVALEPREVVLVGELDEHRRPALAVAVGLVQGAVGAAGLGRRAVVDEHEPGGGRQLAHDLRDVVDEACRGTRGVHGVVHGAARREGHRHVQAVGAPLRVLERVRGAVPVDRSRDPARPRRLLDARRRVALEPGRWLERLDRTRRVEVRGAHGLRRQRSDDRVPGDLRQLGQPDADETAGDQDAQDGDGHARPGAPRASPSRARRRVSVGAPPVPAGGVPARAEPLADGVRGGVVGVAAPGRRARGPPLRLVDHPLRDAPRGRARQVVEGHVRPSARTRRRWSRPALRP
ncbi:hypothetical protein CPER28S_02933 [Cellulomonas persica]